MARTILNYSGEFKRHFFECEKGNRWSECEWKNEEGFWHGNAVSKDDSFCGFSGCKNDDHKIKLVKTLDGESEECIDFQNGWFRSIYKENIIIETFLKKEENGYKFWKMLDSNGGEYWNITPSNQRRPGGGYSSKEYIEDIKGQSF